MPNRILREGILTSEKIATLAWPEEVFYRRLMSIVDDYGRCEAGQQLLRARCYPLQTDAVRTADISRWMAACQKAGLILSYAVSGKQYVEIINFQQQQRSPSKCPAPPADDGNCYQSLADAHLDVVVVVDEGVSVVVGDKPLSRAAPAPVGVRPDVWEAWKRQRGKKLTADAVRLQSAFLAAQPDDPNEIIEQSIRQGWSGLFPLKRDAPASQAVTSKRAATAAAMLRTIPKESDEPSDITAESVRVA